MLTKLSCSVSYYAQEQSNPITLVKNLDEKLIGVRLFRVVKKLQLDSNFKTISEPPGKFRGIISSEIEEWQVQLIVNPSFMSKKMKKRGIYYGLKHKRIIGISWRSPHECKSIGKVIEQHAFDRFGKCN